MNLVHARPFQLVEPQTKWKNSLVRVCWGDESHVEKTAVGIENQNELNQDTFPKYDFAEELKSKIKTLVTSEFTLKKTGIEFVGWNKCDDLNNIDAVIFLTDAKDLFYTIQGAATIGDRGEVMMDGEYRFYGYETSHPGIIGAAYKEGIKSYAWLRFNQEGYFKYQYKGAVDGLLATALHEFGHLSGLRHADLQIKEDKDQCRQSLNNVNGQEKSDLEKEKIGSTAKKVGGFDPDSVMSYCNIYNLKKNITHLSAGDIRALRYLYPEKQASETPSK